MSLRSVVLAVAAISSAGAQAALTTYAPWDSAFAGNGLAGVLFNVQSVGGVTVALGAHAYKNGVSLPNNGMDTFSAQGGIFTPDGLGRANWSFDFAWNLGTACTGCTVTLRADRDPSAGEDYRDLFSTASIPAIFPGESWNMEMGFINGLLAYDFDPFLASSTGFELIVRDATGTELVESEITVNVPEPGTLALLGLGLAGFGALRRRK